MPPLRRFSTILWLLAGIAGALASFAAFTGRGESPRLPTAEPRPTEPAPAMVTVDEARRADLVLEAEATGYVQPWRQVELTAETGARIVSRLVEEGQTVESGQILLRLDDRDRRIELELAQAEWLKTTASHSVEYPAEDGAAPSAAAPAGDEPGRSEELFRQGLISDRELQAARRRRASEQVRSGVSRADVRAATSGLTQAEQRLERAQLELERTVIVAPFRGRVANLLAELGQQVVLGQPLMTLLGDDPMKVEIQVLEADLVRLAVGAPARVRLPALDTAELAGRVATITPRVDPATGTGRVAVALANPGRRLFSGLFASVQLETERLADRLLVPRAAVLERQGREVVFRIVDDLALWTYVETGSRSREWVEIRAGLAAGDRVAVSGHFALAHETPVTIQTTPQGPWNGSSQP
jgi:HlyD family secretion protein